MNYLDIVLAIPLLWAAYRGFNKGFIITAAGLIAIILGIYGAIHFSGFAMSLFLKNYEKNPVTLNIISFTIIFFIIVVVVHLAAKFISSVIEVVSLSFLNRVAGLIFNGLKMGFILSVIIGLLNFFDPNCTLISKKDKTESFLYPKIYVIAPLVFPYLRFDNFNFKIDEPEKSSDAVLKQT